MPKYPPHGNLRVAVLDLLDDLDFPSLTQVEAGVDVTCDLATLSLSSTTQTIDRTPWRGDLVRQDPVREVFTGPHLVGFRFTQPEPEPLWDLAVFRAEKTLVVRRGVPYETAWAASQVVSVYVVQFGARSTTDPSEDVVETFVLPLFVSAYRDASAITA